jgi:serine protease
MSLLRLCLWGLSLSLAVQGVHAASVEASPRMAMGVIVKLRDPQAGRSAASVVRLQAASLPQANAATMRARLALAATRQHVGFRAQKDTAFGAQVLHQGRPVTLAQAQADAARLRQDPDVEWAIPNELARPASVTLNDPDYPLQTWLQARDALSGRMAVANFPLAWDALSGRPVTPVVVAVLDTGILPAPDLDGRLLPGYDFVSEVEYAGDGNGVDPDPTDPGMDPALMPTDPQLACPLSSTSWHGLGVSAILAASTGNALNGAGALAALSGPVVLPVRVSGLCGAQISDIIEGMLWSAGVNYNGSPARNLHPARVINLSFGGDGSCADTGTGARDAAWLYRQTIATLKSQGVLVVASAGNGDDATGLGRSTPTRPANCAGVLAVTGLNERGYKARYANLLSSDGVQSFGVAVASGDVTQVGAQTTISDSGIVTLSNLNQPGQAPLYGAVNMAGTSVAAPQVAAVAALMLAANPDLSVDELLWALTHRVASFPTVAETGLPACMPGLEQQGNCTCTADTCGAGMLDAESAVAWALDRVGQGSSSGGVNLSANATACYFTPSREVGGTACATSSSSQGGGGGGGGSLALGEVLALGALGLWVGWRRRFRGGRR